MKRIKKIIIFLLMGFMILLAMIIDTIISGKISGEPPKLYLITLILLLYLAIREAFSEETKVTHLTRKEFYNLKYVNGETFTQCTTHCIGKHYVAQLAQIKSEFKALFLITEGADIRKEVIFKYFIKDFTRVELTWQNPLPSLNLKNYVMDNYPRVIKYLKGNTLLYTLIIGEDFRIKRITDNRTDEVLFLEDKNEVKNYE